MASNELEFLVELEDAVFVVTANQKIVFWNRAAQRILGFAASDVLGKRCFQVLGGISQGQLCCRANCDAILLARRRQTPLAAIMMVSIKEGKVKPICITHLLMPGAKRATTTLVHMFREPPEAVTRALSLVDELKGLLSQFPKPATTSPKISSDILTRREQEVLRLLCEGLDTKTIAERLAISASTARNHVQRILTKLRVHSRLEAVAAARLEGLL